MKKTLASIALTSLSLSASSVTIDSFNGNLMNGSINKVSDGSLCAPSNASGATSAAIGDHRSLTATNGAGGCANADVNFTTANAYSADLPIASSGIFSVIWNANGAGLSTYMGSSLSLAGFQFWAQQDVNSPPSNAVSVSFKVCTSADGTTGCTTSSSVDVVNDGPSFDAYSATLNGLVQNVQYISMSLNAPAGRDITIDQVNGEVPEPATFAMAGLALVGIGLLRRRS